MNVLPMQTTQKYQETPVPILSKGTAGLLVACSKHWTHYEVRIVSYPRTRGFRFVI